MSTTLQDIVNLVNDRRRDTTNDKIDMTGNGFRCIQSVLRKMQQYHDWDFTIKRDIITYNEGITWYELPTDFKEMQDVRNQKPDRGKEYAYLAGSAFDTETLTNYRYAVETRYNSETGTAKQYLRLKTGGNQSSLTSGTNYTEDGTWVAAAHASNIGNDSYEYFDLASSIKFDFAGTTGTLTLPDMSAKDITMYVDRSGVYCNFYLPTITNFRSIQMRLGSSATVYYSATSTTDFLGYTPVVGWNTFKFSVWETETGTVDQDAVDYIQFTLAYKSSTTDTNFRFENVFVSENLPIYIYYYSTDMVYDVAHAETTLTFYDPTATTDYPLWSGKHDWVTDSFVNGVLEDIFWITGETDDRQQAEKNQIIIFENLKRRLPSKRRYPEQKITLGDDSN